MHFVFAILKEKWWSGKLGSSSCLVQIFRVHMNAQLAVDVKHVGRTYGELFFSHDWMLVLGGMWKNSLLLVRANSCCYIKNNHDRMYTFFMFSVRSVRICSVLKCVCFVWKKYVIGNLAFKKKFLARNGSISSFFFLPSIHYYCSTEIKYKPQMWFFNPLVVTLKKWKGG